MSWGFHSEAELQPTRYTTLALQTNCESEAVNWSKNMILLLPYPLPGTERRTGLESQRTLEISSGLPAGYTVERDLPWFTKLVACIGRTKRWLESGWDSDAEASERRVLTLTSQSVTPMGCWLVKGLRSSGTSQQPRGRYDYMLNSLPKPLGKEHAYLMR